MTATVQRLVVVSATGEFSEYVPATVGGVGSAGMAVALDPNTGLLSLTMMPVGIGPDFVLITATEAINAGAFADIYNSAATGPAVFSARNADGSIVGKPARGFCPAAIASGAAGMVYLSSINSSLAGVVPGPLFLSDTTPGGFLQRVGGISGACPVTTPGHVLQLVGDGISATAAQFVRGQPIIRA